MADRPQRGGGGSRGGFRGRGGGGRGRGDGHSGGGRGDHHSGGGDRDRPKKENILDLARYMDKEVQVKFNGGREDEAKETMRDDEGNETSRPLGLVVIRGTLLVALSPTDGSEPIANPFVQQDEDE
ncbi:hypothetical protein RB595_010659 [Gaeumannomyces hyphopodioides]